MSGPSTPRPPFARPVCVLKSRRFPLTAAEAIDGGTLNALRLVESILEEGIDVEVFTRREEGQPERECHGRLTIYQVAWSPSQASHTMLRDLEEGASFVRSVLAHPAFWPYRFRAVHVHHWTSAVGLPASIPPSVRLVYTPHLLASEKGRSTGLGCPDAVLQSEREILARADTVLALSQAEVRSIRALSGPSAPEPLLAPNGVAPAFFDVAYRPSAPSVPFQLLTIARVTAQKGLLDLIEALRTVVKRGFDVMLTIVGGPYADPVYERSLRERIVAADLEDRVQFVGAVPHRDILAWMERSDVYVQPSRYESQCIALLEAMASGRPVVASRLEAICEYLDNGHHGLLFEPGDTDGLADQIERLLRSSRFSRRLAHQAHARARRYEWIATQKSVLQRLCASAATSPTGEVHDSGLAASLRDHAEERASELARDPGVDAVLLVGSVVSGPVGAGSDVDLYVLREAGHEEEPVPPWRFVSAGVIENVHVAPTSVLEQALGLIGRDDDLADWFYRHPLGDYLARARPLVWRTNRLSEGALQELVTHRLRPAIRHRLAMRYVTEAESLVQTARAMLAEGAPADAHPALRAAAQHTLTAALFRLGWTLRGSKKRPEIAAALLPDRGVESALDLVLELVNLRELTRPVATQLCQSRMRLRSLVVEELRRLASRFDGALAPLQQAEAHERNAADYYEPMVQSYLVRGPINHLRCLSGFPTLPEKLLASTGVESPWPITYFLTSGCFSADLRETWSSLAALESDAEKLMGWVRKSDGVNRLILETSETRWDA